MRSSVSTAGLTTSRRSISCKDSRVDMPCVHRTMVRNIIEARFATLEPGSWTLERDPDDEFRLIATAANGDKSVVLVQEG